MIFLYAIVVHPIKHVLLVDVPLILLGLVFLLFLKQFVQQMIIRDAIHKHNMNKREGNFSFFVCKYFCKFKVSNCVSLLDYLQRLLYAYYRECDTNDLSFYRQIA